MYVARINTKTKSGFYTSYIIRENYRLGKQVKHRDIANITKLPTETIQLIQASLQGKKFLSADEGFTIKRSLQDGHVKAILDTIKRLGLDKIIAHSKSRQRDLVLAMIALRILQPQSKLANSRMLNEETTCYSLGRRLELDQVNEDELYNAMDWLLKRQRKIEKKLSKRHLQDGSLVLYDVSSTYVEGKGVEGAKFGYNRDRKAGKMQVVFGMLCNKEGCPLAIHVFPGNTADPKTLESQIRQMREDFGLKEVTLVGDRGMITQTQIDKHLNSMPGISFITALRAASLKRLVAAGDVQLELFDSHQVVEASSDQYPSERLLVCYNPVRASENGESRESLLKATETGLDRVIQWIQGGRGASKTASAISKKVGVVLDRFRTAKYFTVVIEDGQLSYQRNPAVIAESAQLDGYYVVRTNVSNELLSNVETVRAYKGLSKIESGFRRMKLSGLNIRPMYHVLERRIQTHLFLCMLSYYVTWHMIKALGPLLFCEDHPENAVSFKDSGAGVYMRTADTTKKVACRRTEDGFPLNSFTTLLLHLGSMTMNDIELHVGEGIRMQRYSEPTAVQERAFELLKNVDKKE